MSCKTGECTRLLIVDDDHVPAPGDFERMTSAEFEAYVRDIGFDAQIKAALAEPDGEPVPTRPHEGLPVGSGRTQP